MTAATHNIFSSSLQRLGKGLQGSTEGLSDQAIDLISLTWPITYSTVAGIQEIKWDLYDRLNSSGAQLNEPT